ncbi:MAG TPA: hypothetical protein VG097_11070, partial [Gemmata sp.]|nr:hypothetical protein [Gemmata sp.]
MRLHLLLSRSPDQQASELFHELTKREFAIIDHELGSAPAVELGSFEVAVIDVGGKADAAVAQTKRWRAELGDILLPIVWVLPGTSVEMTARGLEAGADVVLTHPLEETVLLAQIRAGTRLRFIGARVAARANEARLLGEQLQKVYRQIDRELDAARRIQRAN